MQLGVIWIDFKSNLMYKDGKIHSSFTNFCKKIESTRPDLISKHKIRSILNKDMSITRNVNWGALIEDYDFR